jgi:hypothetical protein
MCSPSSTGGYGTVIRRDRCDGRPVHARSLSRVAVPVVRARISRLDSWLSSPKISAVPSLGCSRSSSGRIVVVLRAPFGPRKP